MLATVDFLHAIRDLSLPYFPVESALIPLDMVVIHYLIFAAGLAAISATITRLMLFVRILDVPNERSSHMRPIPNSGGLSIVVTTCIGLLIAHLWLEQVQLAERQILGLCFAAVILASVGLLDDLKYIQSLRGKLAAQIIACGLLLFFDVKFENFDLPVVGNWNLGYWAYPVTMAWVLGLTNVYNFMDGLDGLAAGTTLLVAACFGLLALAESADLFALFCLILFSATLGFFVFNFPLAKIFMGDVGSQFVGFVFAALAVLASQHDRGGALAYVLPLLLFHFLFDGVFTFIRRLFAGENVTQAHKQHLYQLVNQIGFSHPQVSCLHFAMVLWQAAGAIVIVRGEIDEPGWVLLPFFGVQSIYAAFVLIIARRRGLLG